MVDNHITEESVNSAEANDHMLGGCKPSTPSMTEAAVHKCGLVARIANIALGRGLMAQRCPLK